MKKVSAFSVFKKKDKTGDTPTLERKNSGRGSIKKASSTPVISEGSEKTSNKIIKAFKGGSFRATIRGNKHRPSVLPNGSGDSPFVASDDKQGIKLTGVKDKNKKGSDGPTKKAVSTESLATDAAPKLPPKPRMSEVTPRLGQRRDSKQETPKSSDSIQQKKAKAKPLPPVPAANLETPKTGGLNGSISHKAGQKRSYEDNSPPASGGKKKRVTSPKDKPVVHVTPQKKEKPHQKKVWQSVALEPMYDSQEEARKMFECMIYPVQVDKFLKELWEKKPLLVQRHIENYNDGWFSTKELDRILDEEHIVFGENLDVTSYINGKRETHNPPGRANRAVVWDFYQQGCSVRMLNPQTYCKSVWKMLSVLQEYFGCCVGANVYLTPPGTQGFAPHYDDIEAFILQLEGKKRWRLYNPRNQAETLPRESSGNFTEDDIGEPILDVTLQAGDLLYFPRGTIHQGHALEDAHSLHITVSCYQKNTYADLLEKLVPAALAIAKEEDLDFRQGLPLDYLNFMGVANSDMENTKRDAFIHKVTNLMTKMIANYSPIDAACDQLGKQYIHDSLPPCLTDAEKSCSIFGQGEKWDAASKSVKGTVEIEPDTMIKLIRKGSIRLITEEDSVRVYHNLENARLYRAREPQYIEVSADLAMAVEHLIHSYPEYVSVDSLPLPSTSERVEIASALYDKGLLVSGDPLDTLDDDEEDDDEVVEIH